MNATWLTRNQHSLSAALARTRDALVRYVGTEDVPLAAASPTHAEESDDAADSASALDLLVTAFGLSDFERDVLLLCAGIELDANIRALCITAQGGSGRGPTFGLALAALPGAHWSAVSPDAPLRRWQLIELAERDEPLTATPLRISERVLHYLTGVACEDPKLRGVAWPLRPMATLPESHQQLAEELAAILSRPGPAGVPVVQLCGPDNGDKRALAAAACAEAGLGLYVMRAGDLPTYGRERFQLGRIWEREAVLESCALMIDVTDQDSPEVVRTTVGFAEALRGIVLLATRDALRLSGRSTLRIDVPRPTPIEQRVLWRAALGEAAVDVNGELDRVLGNFDLSAESVQAIGAQARLTSDQRRPVASVLWEACRAQNRPKLDGLAQRIPAASGWDELVLPEVQIGTLHQIAAQVRSRHQVYQTWGFAAQGARGLGVTALFAGASGTGKTLAAEVLAGELHLDLYRIDLSQVVSKYIGETEKNLRRVFEAAEGSGAILLFDEADALFGKRSEVKDSHDRFANIEISYLLQQMEAYRGLAILTTNLKTALDPAFLRRIRFVVQFPFPGEDERARIWCRIFPASTPTESLDPLRLARLNVAGGNIRNIALNAAFLAAAEGTPVRMEHLLRAARGEYEKLERPLTESDAGGWV